MSNATFHRLSAAVVALIDTLMAQDAGQGSPVCTIQFCDESSSHASCTVLQELASLFALRFSLNDRDQHDFVAINVSDYHAWVGSVLDDSLMQRLGDAAVKADVLERHEREAMAIRCDACHVLGHSHFAPNIQQLFIHTDSAFAVVAALVLGATVRGRTWDDREVKTRIGEHAFRDWRQETMQRLEPRSVGLGRRFDAPRVVAFSWILAPLDRVRGADPAQAALQELALIESLDPDWTPPGDFEAKVENLIWSNLDALLKFASPDRFLMLDTTLVSRRSVAERVVSRLQAPDQGELAAKFYGLLFADKHAIRECVYSVADELDSIIERARPGQFSRDLTCAIQDRFRAGTERDTVVREVTLPDAVWEEYVNQPIRTQLWDQLSRRQPHWLLSVLAGHPELTEEPWMRDATDLAREMADEAASGGHQWDYAERQDNAELVVKAAGAKTKKAIKLLLRDLGSNVDWAFDFGHLL